MTSITHTPSTLRQTLRYAEWALLLMVMLLYAIDQYLQKIQVFPDLFFKALVFLILFFILSFIFPVDRPRWQRRGYIAFEIGCVLVAQLFWVELNILLYFFLIKSCFLLSRREVILTVVITGVGYLSSLIWTMPLLEKRIDEMIRSNQWEELYQPQAILVGSLVGYVGISLFVVLLGFVIVAERRSRQRAEALALEIETLAAALERSRIARDIHDSLGHSLTTLNIQLELSQAMAERDPLYASQALSNARHLASQCLDSVRQAVQTVRQETFNLTITLQKLIEQIQQNYTFTIHTEVNLPSLTPQTSHQLYCIIQEGFTNIQKHAQASQVYLISHIEANNIILELVDNGQGFDPTLPTMGYGIKGMYERAHLLGGELRITSTIKEGTHIRVTVPL